MYSPIEIANANGLEQYDYLHHVPTHIAAAEMIKALLPWNVCPRLSS